MTIQSRFSVGCLVASLIAWSAPANTRADAQQPETHVVVPVQPDEAAPIGKKHRSAFDPLQMEGFSVALLLGETQGTSTSDNVPEGAKKALADLREFLPYKSYRVLDTQWIRCCAGPSVGGTLRGLDEVQYGYRISIDGVSGTKMTASFTLDAGPAHFKSGNVTHDAFGKPLPVKRVISSHFSMDTGETVVIGTSSLKGEKALVVLLTAVSRAATSTKAKKRP